MSPGRFNKISATYEIEKQIPTPQKITFGEPVVHCVGIRAQQEGKKPDKKVYKYKYHKNKLNRQPRGKDTPCAL